MLAFFGIAGPGFGQSAINENSADHLFATATNFITGFRPDITLPDQKTFVSKMNSTNGVVHFVMPQGREAVLTIDSSRDEVTSFSTFKGFSSKRYFIQQNINRNEIATNKDVILKKLGIDTNSIRLVLERQFGLSANSKQEMVKYLWQRQVQGFPFKDDYLALTFDAQDGELLSVKKSFGLQPNSLKVKVALKDAKQIATDYLLKIQPDVKIQFVYAGIEVVTPNLTGSEPSNLSNTRKLAWVLKWSKPDAIDYPAEIWVDTETGRVLGYNLTGSAH